MKQLLCFLPWLLLSLLMTSQFSEARFVVEKNSLSVTSPESIKGTHDSAIGNFGIPQYGGSMAGTVVYPKENQKSCKEFSDFSISFKSQPGALPTFLLVDRGDCFFALKVWNAQKAGASAVLVADNVDEPLITMDTPEEDVSSAKYIENITIPSALVTKGFGEKLKKAISGGDMVNLNLDWREAVPHPDDRVEYELWTNSNDECGVKCDMLMEFVKDFKGAAQILEKGGFTQFRPHYITWYCPHAFTLSRQCKSQCINKGRYCAPDPEQDFSSGYDGKDVVVENLRQLCVFKVANETGKPWVWWDYVTDFQIRCPMKEKKYNRDCAESVIKSLGIDSKKIDKCMGDPDADMDNPVLKEEQDAQVGKGSRGDVTILPTLVVNNRQYRGKLEKSAVLKALCSGFEESTEPAICLSTDMETNECLDNNGGCWQDKSANITACKDTFRGKVCVCPIVDGVRFKGDGYSHCERECSGHLLNSDYDYVDEPLITMDTPEEDVSSAKYIENITIPSALVTKGFGEKLKKAISGGDMVNLNLDWREAVPHPDDRVEYELWTNSNDECGVKCDMLMEFVKDFKGAAQILEKGGFTQFRPHYITWYCPHAFTLSKQCKSQCINKGRYCAPDPEQDFSSGYDGKDVVVENLRQLCVFKVANETGKPWVWWDYVTDFQIRCPMKEKKYNKDCADSVIKSLGIDSKKLDKCMGDPDADKDNPVLKEEQDAQVGKGSRGDVTILPTLVVNNRQYRGKLEKSAVLKALCSGFEETTEPAICLSTDVESNECLDNNGGCWQDKSANITACKDTFRGRVCECPRVDGVLFKGDGYSHCEPSGPGRCTINNGGCWHEERDGHAFSACVDKDSVKCECPPGFKGDGIKKCEDINECKEKKACQCPECSCKNTWGSYECSCSGDLLYIRDHDTCISKTGAQVKSAWAAVWLIMLSLGLAAAGAYLVYKYRLRRYMDSEIRAIMAQYMPLDSQPEVPNHVNDERA